jgi:23S rRNA pseudouridine1911/1915/1917 synthase
MIEEEIQEESDDILFEHQRFVVDAGQGLVRIDKFLNAKMHGVTRSKIQNGIDNGFVKVNDQQITKFILLMLLSFLCQPLRAIQT